MMMPGAWELIIIGGIVVLLFGAKKLPALGGAIGESIKNFKKGVTDKEPKPLNASSDDKEGSNDSK